MLNMLTIEYDDLIFDALIGLPSQYKINKFCIALYREFKNGPDFT